MAKSEDIRVTRTVSLRFDLNTWEKYKLFCKHRGFTATKRIRSLILADLKIEILEEKEKYDFRIETLESKVKDLETKAFFIPSNTFKS